MRRGDDDFEDGDGAAGNHGTETVAESFNAPSIPLIDTETAATTAAVTLTAISAGGEPTSAALVHSSTSSPFVSPLVELTQEEVIKGNGEEEMGIE